MNEFQRALMPGDKVLLYDSWANGREAYYKGDGAWQNATIIRRYGKDSRDLGLGVYPDLIDVVFDITGRKSRGHFTDGALEPIPY